MALDQDYKPQLASSYVQRIVDEARKTSPGWLVLYSLCVIKGHVYDPQASRICMRCGLYEEDEEKKR